MNDRIPFELRVLSGLHRGASLPVDEQPQLIGASDDADVVLVDPGIAQRHAMLRLEAGGWSLLAMDGAVRGAQHDAAEDQHVLAPGQAARVGHVWLTVSPGDAPWQEPPPDPPAGSAPPADEAPAPEPEAEPEGEAEPEPAAVAAEAEPEHDAASNPAPPAPPRRRSRMVALPAALGVMLLAVGTYAYSSRTAGPSPVAAPPLAQAPLPKPPGPDELRAAFRQRLAEVDLLRRFDMTLEDRAWTLRASLDDEETARFRRILAAFVAAHKIDFPIDVRIGGPDAMLPFRVTQVISGANASIVTDDGQRLYPGDDYRGVKLVAIDGNRLRFNGERSIEVKW